MSDSTEDQGAASPQSLADWAEAVTEQSRQEYLAHGTLPRVEAPRRTRLPKPPRGWRDRGYAITFDGKLAILREPDGSATPDRATLSIFDGDAETGLIEVPSIEGSVVFDRLADGSWIFASDWRPQASHLSSDGTLLSRPDLGQDIKQLQADPQGGFWIGYGDQGVYTGSEGPMVSNGGVVRFDGAGKPIWSMNGDGDDPCIAWCDHSYALNISAEARWAYTYSEFLLSRLDPAPKRRSFRPMVTFASAIAVSGDRILLAGMDRPGRNQSWDRLVLLGPPGRWTPARPRKLWTATIHRAINPREHLWTGRGDTLHQVRGKTWHRLSIDEAEQLVPPGPWRNVPDVSG